MLISSEIMGSKATLQDAKRVATSSFRDLRGTFDVIWETKSFSSAGLQFQPVSFAYSYNDKLGTLRGLHYQKQPYGQSKLVSCIRGRVWDVIADLRPDSSSYLSWAFTELSESTGQAVFIPAGYAHGFITLSDHSTVAYLIEGAYVAESAGIVRWDDTSLGIIWPNIEPILSDRDRHALDFIS